MNCQANVGGSDATVPKSRVSLRSVNLSGVKSVWVCPVRNEPTGKERNSNSDFKFQLLRSLWNLLFHFTILQPFWTLLRVFNLSSHVLQLSWYGHCILSKSIQEFSEATNCELRFFFQFIYRYLPSRVTVHQPISCQRVWLLKSIEGFSPSNKLFYWVLFFVFSLPQTLFAAGSKGRMQSHLQKLNASCNHLWSAAVILEHKAFLMWLFARLFWLFISWDLKSLSRADEWFSWINAISFLFPLKFCQLFFLYERLRAKLVVGCPDHHGFASDLAPAPPPPQTPAYRM